MTDARQADHDARREAQRELSRPLVLEAGAGTGKTTTLVARVLSWCLGPGWERTARRLAETRRAKADSAAGEISEISGETSDEEIAAEVLRRVVAITFTEAAAAEMAGRTAKELVAIAGSFGKLPDWLDPAPLPSDRERVERARALIGTLDHLAVRTIHAFCRGLLAAHPLEAGRHPTLTVDADGSLLEEIAREAVEARLRDAYGEPGDADLLALAAEGCGPPEVLDALWTLASAGLPAAALEADPFHPGAVAALAGRLAGAAGRLAEILAAARSGPRSNPRSSPSARGNLPQIAAGLDHLVSRLVSRPAEALPDLAELQSWAGELLPANLVQHLKKWGKGELSSQSEQERLGGAARPLAAAAGELARLLAHLADLDPGRLNRARRALAPLLHQVEEELAARGIETFQSLLAGAAALLSGVPEVRTRVRRDIDQLLVDEFQDTDRLQCQILRLLALDGPAEERPGLFIVGDPKQSIYGWRSADLAAYDGFVAEVVAAGGLVLPLVENFRSVPAILAEVARAVGPVMRHQPGLQPRFEPLLACPAKAELPGFVHDGTRPRRPVEFWLSWKADGEPAETLARTRPGAAAEIEARALAADLVDLHRTHGVGWRQIGVLMRSTGDLDVYLDALRRAGVPFVVGRDKQYYRRREIIEAAALVRAVLDPGDHVALLTVLRSAIVGVPDAALIPLWKRGFPGRLTELHRPEQAAGLAALIAEAAADLPAGIPGLAALDGWEQNLLAAVESLGDLRQTWETAPADLFVERLRRQFLVEPTEAARYLGAYRLANLDRFFRDLAVTLDEGKGDIVAVLRLLRQNVSLAVEAEEARPQEGEDAVAVLTIHGAKGLDFEHVYLLQAHKLARGDSATPTEVATLPAGGAPVLQYRLFGAPTPDFDRVEAERAAVEAAERVRTLYVAMTRAKERLVVAGAWPQRDPAPEPHQAKSHAELLLSRGEAPPPLELWQQALDAGRCHTADETGALWYFPALDAVDPSAEKDGERPRLPGVDEVRRSVARLAAQRVDARRRMARPWSAAASEEAHQRLRELQAERRFAERDGAPGGKPGGEADGDREVAMAAGGAVHRALESWNLDAGSGSGSELARQRGLLASYLRSLVGEDPRSQPALRRAEALLDRFAAGPLFPRFTALGDRVVARELAVLLPPGGGEGAPVGQISGSVDLLYADGETGALVVADYKTDEVDGNEELAARAAVYAPQGAAYVRAVTEALQLPAPPRFELWFLAAGQIVRPRV